MIDTQLQDTIHRASIVAYQAGVKEGRRLENEFFWKALDLNSTGSEFGDLIYINDLKDALEELANEDKVS
jgi:hypothetical protein